MKILVVGGGGREQAEVAMFIAVDHPAIACRDTRRQTDWYRTDQNGTITLRWPAVAGNGYSIEVERGGRNLDGPSDRRGSQAKCR